jgi:glutamate/tyrosine decarboxylase-like PLP-dependent enzyme
MSFRGDPYDQALTRAAAYARAWLDSVAERPVGPRATAAELLAAFDGPLPEGPTPPEDVVDMLATLSEPGLMAIQSGRFFGWVMGGTLPAALAADWLVSAWDQNTGMRHATPATATAEEAAAGWLLELLGLPTGADVGFVTGAMMANFTCLGAARTAVLSRLGWDVGRDGLAGAPKVRVLAGEERHDTVDLALRYLGLGSPTLVAADDQGRIRVDALAESLNAVESGTPVVVCLQAGNVHSGAFDPLEAAIEIAHEHHAWVHVDGAFGLWAAAAPSLSHLVAGAAGADSLGTDAHKTLNVPYDCGIAIVADPVAMRSTFGAHASYLITDDSGPGDPFEKVPEFSRRARGVPVWAALRSLGRSGVAALVEGLAGHARAMADGIAGIDGARVVNDVVYTQVCVEFGDDARTRAVTARLIADGTVWMSGSRWRGRNVLRSSVSNWATDADDVRRSVDAIRRASTDASI